MTVLRETIVLSILIFVASLLYASVGAGVYATLDTLPASLPGWLVVAGIGGLIGATIGSRYLPAKTMRLVLAGVLVISGVQADLLPDRDLQPGCRCHNPGGTS
ncbi:MAG: hypothetical protein ACREQ1_06575 [Woeseiaceae bacterium]